MIYSLIEILLNQVSHFFEQKWSLGAVDAYDASLPGQDLYLPEVLLQVACVKKS
jgi:hypothetical protein